MLQKVLVKKIKYYQNYKGSKLGLLKDTIGIVWSQMHTTVHVILDIIFIFFAIYLVNRAFFSIVQLWCLLSPEPLVLQKSYIPHWKALIFSFLEV